MQDKESIPIMIILVGLIFRERGRCISLNWAQIPRSFFSPVGMNPKELGTHLKTFYFSWALLYRTVRNVLVGYEFQEVVHYID